MEIINTKNLGILAIIIIIIILLGSRQSGNYVSIVGHDENNTLSINLYDSEGKPIKIDNSFSIINYAGTDNFDVPGVAYIDFTAKADIAPGSSSLSCQITSANPNPATPNNIWTIPSSIESLIPSRKESAAWTSNRIATADYESESLQRFSVTVTCSGSGFTNVIREGYVDLYIKTERTPNWCYQEDAIEAVAGDGACGLSYTGRYVLGGGVNSAYFHDNSWTTYTYGGSTGNNHYINYSKPANSLSSSLWKVKDYNGEENLIIPAECWNYNPSTLVLKAYTLAGGDITRCSAFGLNSPCSVSRWSCGYSPSPGVWSWVTLRQNSVIGSLTYTARLFSEAMDWDIA